MNKLSSVNRKENKERPGGFFAGLSFDSLLFGEGSVDTTSDKRHVCFTLVMFRMRLDITLGHFPFVRNGQPNLACVAGARRGKGRGIRERKGDSCKK